MPLLIPLFFSRMGRLGKMGPTEEGWIDGAEHV